MELTGTLFDIKRFAVHDGPGIRTVLFLKGCTLHCDWCHNPEGIRRQPDLVHFESKCVQCGACVAACPNQALELQAGGITIDRQRCEHSGECLEVCYAGALFRYGREVSVAQVMADLRQDADFYRSSGGGVTLSGGEPLLQADFSIEVLRQCKAEGFHTALDTCGNIPWAVLERALPYTDLVLYDLKHFDSHQHQHYTGASNATLLENLRRLDQRRIPLEIRIPLIPGVNDGENLRAVGAFLHSFEQPVRVRLLPYHRLAGSKYQRLGRENRMPQAATPGAAQLQAAADQLSAWGCQVVIG
jgi:pyruvate formate lyase activating enzyme